MDVEAITKEEQKSDERDFETSDTSSTTRGDLDRSNVTPQGYNSEKSADHQSSSPGGFENGLKEKSNGNTAMPEINIELERIEINKRIPSANTQQWTDLELLTRPSWCDAKFALSQVNKGRAKGNRYALALRAVLHQGLFRLGRFIQKYAPFVLVIGLLILGGFGVGLKDAFLETNLEELWVESGGELAEEIQHTRNTFAQTNLSDNGAEYTFQMLIQTGEDTLNLDSLLLHLRAASAAIDVSVEQFNRTWSYTDLCYKFDVSSFVSSDASEVGFESLVGQIVESILPCLIIGPLDCFWEGSKLLETGLIPLFVGNDGRPVSWRNLNLLQQFDLFGSIGVLPPSLQQYRQLLIQAGLENGYTDRPCLNPNDDECPRSSPNYRGDPPNINVTFNQGCTGFATELMQWPLDLIIGGIERNATSYVTGAQGLQTIFTLRTPESLLQVHRQADDTIDGWDLKKAEKVLRSWQRKFVEEMYTLAENKSFTLNVTDQIDAFSEATAADILLEFSSIAIPRLVGGYVLMIAYAYVTLMKFRASTSQGAVGVSGVLLVVLSVVAGLGLCSAVGISLNAASVQVLPFLLLGLGVDDMFLMSHHFGEISVMTHIPIQDRVGECLKRVGVSVVLTSVAILSGFLFSLIIPMPALQAFVLQAAVVTIFNLITVLIIFPAILSLDLTRRQHNRYDVLCCFKSSSKNLVTGPEYENISGPNHSKPSQEKCKAFFSLSLSQMGERYYAPFLLKNPVRVIVLFLFALLLGGSIYGCTKVKDGLDLGDVLPRGTREHAAIVAQTSYFAFYNMYIVTQEFDYPSNQKEMDRLHDSMENLSYVLRNIDGSLQKYWLQYMREWVKLIQTEFDQDWDANNFNLSGWMEDASDNAILGYKLLIQTKDSSSEVDKSLVRCKNNATTCNSTDLEKRLLTADGEIPRKIFYKYLTAWASSDVLTVAAAQALIQPAPVSWSHDRNDANLSIPASPNIIYAQMPFYLNNMRENEDFVFVINWVRGLINSVEAESSIIAFPSGYPFTFWQQYITLRFWLFISLGCVIAAVFFVLSIILLNPWAAGIMALFLAMIATELLGFMGATGVKLSAVPAVILVASIGLGVEFTVHITFAYITSCGTRKERVIYSIGHMTGPVIDGSISTLLGVIMLAWAEFDFIVTYFFQVLAVLILLGVLNGLVLLPVVLSFIGPPPEITPKDGGSRLATPTPPSTPIISFRLSETRN